MNDPDLPPRERWEPRWFYLATRAMLRWGIRTFGVFGWVVMNVAVLVLCAIALLITVPQLW